MMKITLITTPDNDNTNIKVVESTLDDAVMEYTIPCILKMIKLPSDYYYISEAVNVVHEITFSKATQ